MGHLPRLSLIVSHNPSLDGSGWMEFIEFIMNNDHLVLSCGTPQTLGIAVFMWGTSHGPQHGRY